MPKSKGDGSKKQMMKLSMHWSSRESRDKRETTMNKRRRGCYYCIGDDEEDDNSLTLAENAKETQQRSANETTEKDPAIRKRR